MSGSLKLTFFITTLIMLLILGQRFYSSSNEIDYNTQVKPIFNNKCIFCHGGVKQNGGFSLMTRESALAINESGRAAVVPGKPDSSELLRRIHLEDPDDRMPQEGPPLTKKEIKILTRWIKQGARWDLHWAYQPIDLKNQSAQTRMGLSFSNSLDSDSKQIDILINEQLNNLGLSLNPQAKNSELLRRVSYDLIGMPAPISLQQKFLDGNIKYETLVDSLLRLESFGEKWASMWLDIARYADSKGFERDQNRSIWPYRDYIIQSFNKDKPYDQFIIEQLAGDLLTEPTDETLIATGFHRNTTTNDEGGTNNEEYRVKAVMDRVNTTWQGLMGTTMACVQCHGHPYDPFPHIEYYQSMAFLNNTRDADTHMDYPLLQLLDTISQARLDSLTEWINEVANKEKADEIKYFVKTGQPVIYSIETDQFENAVLYDTKYLGLRKEGKARIPNVPLDKKTMMLMRAQTNVDGGSLHLHLDKADGKSIGKIKLKNTKNEYQLMEIPLQLTAGIHHLYLSYTNSKLIDPNKPGIQIDWFYFTNNFPGATNSRYALNKARFENLLFNENDRTLILTENPPERQRKTFVFDRGNWLVPAVEVTPAVPGILPPLNKSNKQDRLAFAEWIASKENPLTSRTFVNRVWEQLFGQGIVITVEDLGSQGATPSHPELLDYLSYHWMHEQNWRIKSLLKTIVQSDTYRQSAKISKTALEKDPTNQFLSRGPRVRLSAEEIRDQALYISGLLNPKMFGPPVMPQQPEGIWQTPYNSQQWTTSENGNQYRRAVYTMIKRTAVYPSFETFDMAQRQVCTSRRIRTNTPLQALVTLNDPVYVEAAKALATRMLQEGGANLSDQINFAYRLVMSRQIPEKKKEILEKLYQKSLLKFSEEDQYSIADSHYLALSNMASAMMNLDEFLNK